MMGIRTAPIGNTIGFYEQYLKDYVKDIGKSTAPHVLPSNRFRPPSREELREVSRLQERLINTLKTETGDMIAPDDILELDGHIIPRQQNTGITVLGVKIPFTEKRETINDLILLLTHRQAAIEKMLEEAERNNPTIRNKTIAYG